MPATPRRVPAGTTLAALLLITTSCTGLDQASAAGVTRQDLAAEMAGEVAAAAGLTYTATYRLAGGSTAQIVRTSRPDRTAYLHPGGRVIRTPSTVTQCTYTVCTTTDARAPANPRATATGERTTANSRATTGSRAVADLPAATGMVAPEAVLAMLETAAIDPGLEFEQHDTTLAGRHATCVTVSGSGDYTVCVTIKGVLARFTGRVDGTAVEMELIDYAEEASESDFAIPPGARLVDRRHH
ncbi:hypothetical protein AB0F81_31940 [Actinoplanes sp. NPDC024001]|uniref:hypothetical protein n=1 Tax=Actinoplanes sp. NPDC024001 TaxID=3154598 RepID=UPI0034038C2F